MRDADILEVNGGVVGTQCESAIVEVTARNVLPALEIDDAGVTDDDVIDGVIHEGAVHDVPCRVQGSNEDLACGATGSRAGKDVRKMKGRVEEGHYTQVDPEMEMEDI